MGWCSGTYIFDEIAEFLLTDEEYDEEKFLILYKLAKALEEQDWDCQMDSNFFDYQVVQKVFKTLHPDWDWTSPGLVLTNL